MTRESGASGPGSYRLRPATPSDIPRLVELLRAEDLPAGRIEEQLAGFVVAERSGVVVGGGGLELYETSGLLRSVVIAPSERGAGLGRVVATHLEEMARAAGCVQVYLFSVGAWQFWEHLGYAELAIEDWSEAARRSWQHTYVSAHLDRFRAMGIHSMWKQVA